MDDKNDARYKAGQVNTPAVTWLVSVPSLHVPHFLLDHFKNVTSHPTS